MVDQLSACAGTQLQSKLVGEPAAVADALRSLEALGIDRIGITPMTVTTAENLAPALYVDN